MINMQIYYSLSCIVQFLFIASLCCSFDVNPYRFKRIIEAEPCRLEKLLLVVVHSSVEPVYRRRRMLLRSSWLDKSRFAHEIKLPVKVVFFLGLSGDSSIQDSILYESELYRDIVQSDFIDHYHNNTYKAMSYLQWTSEHCRNVSMIMKMDDDVLINYNRMSLLQYLIDRMSMYKYPVYAGHVIPEGKYPDRHPKSKWYISKHVWPDETFPIWHQGLAYFLSPSITGELFRLAEQTPYMFTDDVYMGVLVNKLNKSTRILVIDLKHFSADYRATAEWENGPHIFFHTPNFLAFWSMFKDSRLPSVLSVPSAPLVAQYDVHWAAKEYYHLSD